MGIFDLLKKFAAPAVKEAAKALSTQTESFSFSALPKSVEELKALPEASLDTPFKTAALTVCALCAYVDSPEVGKEMLNFLKGPQPLSTREIQFMNDRFREGKYVPVSFFAGAKPENDYTPDKPFRITVSTNPYSFQEENYAMLWMTSGGADSPRSVKLRKKGDQWFLWEQFLLSGIRKAKSEDPWA